VTARGDSATGTSAALGREIGPSVTVPYPGPRARRIIERMRSVEGAGPRTGGDDPPLVVESATGSTLTDPDGNRFVDLAGSFAAATIGHAHPAVVAAVRDQVGRLSHVSSASISEPRVAFEEALVGIAPAGLDRVLLGLTGSDANDTAVRLARTATGRREVLAFSGGYFGRGSGVIGLNGKARFRGTVGMDADAHFLPYPDPYRWPLGRDADASAGALALVRHALESPASGVGPVAAVIVEPVQGNGGVVLPPDGFLAGLRDLCDQHGAVLIFDEVQSGFGRTGRVWAAEHWAVIPDLMTVGKGIGGGLALSAVVGRHELMAHWPAGTHTSTFMGDAVNLAAGSAAIGVLRAEHLPDRSAVLGASALERLRTGLAGEPGVGEIRGLGLFIGIELVLDHDTREPDPARTARIRRAGFDRGVVLGSGGTAEQVIKVCPSLTIDEVMLEASLDLTIETIRGTR
jgi:4-aminobutyrate aminotransferase